MATWRQLLPGQTTRIHIYDLEAGTDEVIHTTNTAIAEAPNWTLDGSRIIFNENGELYSLQLSDGSISHIDSGSVSDFNNDHVLDPDGEHIFATSEDGHIYRVPLTGGEAERVTQPEDGLMAHYLHGVSPDGNVLLHIGGKARAEGAVYNVYSYNRTTKETVMLTDSPKPHDGSEFSPDGKWIYFNSERNSTIAGHSQLFRMLRDGSCLEQLTFDERVNWFPHLTPEGSRLVYISFPPGTQGHPANEPVQLVVSNSTVTVETLRFDLFGGQGSLNVNSWAPDSTRFAFADYPIDKEL